MGPSHSHDHCDNVVAYSKQIGFAEKRLFPAKQVII